MSVAAGSTAGMMTADAGQARGTAGAADGGKAGTRASVEGQAGSAGNDARIAGTSGAAAAVKIDRSSLTNVGSGPLDYANPALWACRPGNDPDLCSIELTATEILKDQSRKVVADPPAIAPTFDCFYLYPTVYFGQGNMEDFSDLSAVSDPVTGQIARFGRVCRLYVPLYRQTSTELSAEGTGVAAGDLMLGTQDALAAFDYYLSHLNAGRRFAILGHSQGTIVATSILQARIDDDATLRGQLISAVLIGAEVRAPAGQIVGGTFKNIPACTKPGENGCAITYGSYAADNPPTSGALKETAQGKVLCTEPAALAGRPAARSRGSYFQTSATNLFFSPIGGYLPLDLETSFMLYRDYFTTRCVDSGGYSYLEVSIAKTQDDQREDPPWRAFLEGTGIGLHIYEYGLLLDDLIDAVQLQAEAGPLQRRAE